MSLPRRKTALFVRASLQLGGADRLVLTEALALANAGWSVEIWVNENRIETHLEESRDQRIKIRQYPTRIPLYVAGAPRNGCRLLRQWLLVLKMAKTVTAPALFVVDECEHSAWWLRQRFPETPIIYYCNSLQVPSDSPANFLRAWYRGHLERLRAKALLATQAIAFNSKFIRAAAMNTWPFLSDRNLAVMYPGTSISSVVHREAIPSEKIFLCLGRISPEKRLDVSITALAKMRAHLTAAQFASCRLVIAGGYSQDDAVQKNTLNTLTKLSAGLGLGDSVEFCLNLDDEAVANLRAKSFALVHPMPDEHFGLAPIEAMACGLPVLAVNNGGPAETVVDGVTGALRPFDGEAFAQVMAEWVQNPAKAYALGQAGRECVAAHFSLGKFERDFVALAEKLVANPFRS